MRIKLFFTLILCLLTNQLISQVSDIVTIKTLGQGKTVQDATTQALREAISQAYGVFISANTTIVNDSLLKDEIVSLTTGNIQKYSILSQTEVPGIGYSVFVNADVSLTKLSSYAQSKGSEATFDGGGFAMNIKLQKLNEQAEFVAINNLLTQTWHYINSAVQFDVKIGDPHLIPKELPEPKTPQEVMDRAFSKYSVDESDILKYSNSNEDYYNLKVGVSVTIPDSTSLKIESFLLNGLEQISMTQQEHDEYVIYTKPIYRIDYIKGNAYDGNYIPMVGGFELRNRSSLKSIFVFNFKLNNIFNSFTLSSNKNSKYEYNGYNEFNIFRAHGFIPRGGSPFPENFREVSHKYLLDSAFLAVLYGQFGDSVIHNSTILRDISAYNDQDIIGFDHFLGMFKSLDYPDYQKYIYLATKPPYSDWLKTGWTFPKYRLDHEELDETMAVLDSRLQSKEFFFNGLPRTNTPSHAIVKRVYSFNLTLSELEQLKDFKVTKVTN